MNKPIKYTIIALVLVFSFYNAVYIKDLDAVKALKTKAVFNAKDYADDFIENKVQNLLAIDASSFLTGISEDVKSYSESKGNKLGISDDYYFIIDGKATVEKIEEENVLVTLQENKNRKLKIATDFIFGNAIREGAKMANIGDYQNTMDYNNISVELNNIVRETIVSPFKKSVKENDSLYFKGAVKVNVNKPQLDNLRVIPLILDLKK